jgi:PDZ domain-containing protein
MARPTIQPAAVVISVTDTQQPIVPTSWGPPQVITPSPCPALAVRKPSKVHRWWTVPLMALGALLPAVVVLAAIVPSGTFVDKQRCTARDEAGECTATVTEPVEYALVPASADPVNPRLTVRGVPQYPSSADVHFVTISGPRPEYTMRLLEWFVSRSNPAVVHQSRFDSFGDETPQQQRQRGQESMRSAKEVAIYVAFQKVGYEAELVPGEVRIDDLVCLEADASGQTCTRFAPSDVELDPGDTLLRLDGVKLDTVEDLTPVLAEKQPGDTVDVEYRRDGEVREGQIELIASPDDPERTIVGFFPSDTAQVRLDDSVEVVIDTDQVGGPSAGAAFTVTLIDELTEGDLLGGKEVAITGTINLDGTVGAIGGLSSKASAVLQNGLKYFLVPVDQGEDDIAKARRVVGDEVQIIPVASIDEILQVLSDLGGDALVPVDVS